MRLARYGKAGLTLIEVTIYASLLAVVGAPLLQVVRVSTRSMAEVDAFNKITERNRVTLFRVAQEIRRALSATTAVQNSGKTLVFTLADGFDGAAAIPGDTIHHKLELVAGERANGLDDNGNGLVDEGRLVRVNVNTGEENIVCEGLDLSGSSFALNGAAVTVLLRNSTYVRNGDSEFAITRQVTVTPRN